MNRTERVFRDREPDGGNGAESQTLEDPSQETNQENLTDPSGPSDEGQQSPFSDAFSLPFLKGKTPQEIEAMFLTSDAAIREQRARLNRYEDQENRQLEKETPKSDPSSADMFEKPGPTFRALIREEMEEIIAPFKQDIAERKQQAAWQEIEAEKGDLSAYKPYMNEILRLQGIRNPNADQIRAAYLTALGYITDHQMRNGGGNQPSKQPDNSGQRRNPQHSASKPNIQQPRPQAEPTRKITEAERRHARMRGWTDEEYLKYSDEDYNPFAEENK